LREICVQCKKRLGKIKRNKVNIKEMRLVLSTRRIYEKRVTGFEPVVSTLGKLHVTTTPNPLIISDDEDYSRCIADCQAMSHPKLLKSSANGSCLSCPDTSRLRRGVWTGPVSGEETLF
jgi:hypothetical protein